MSMPVVEASLGARAAPRLRYDWLFSRRADLAMVLVPVVATAVAFVWALGLGEDVRGSAHGFAGWAAAYLFGNTSHVLLSYLLLGARRDVLHATETQARTVISGSLVVFFGSLALMRLTHNDPWTQPFYETVTVVFATHHTLSQAKGFWALYGLRGAERGLPAPSARERELQKLFVPLGLLFIAAKWTLVGRVSEAFAGPFMNVNPGEPAVLPFLVTYALLAAWLVYAAAVLRELLSYEAVNFPKVFYLGIQCGVVALELLSPGWGVTIAAGIHGLEYYFLTRRMLEPTASEASGRLTRALCWPVMFAAMSPILIVGVISSPWFPAGAVRDGVGGWALMLVNACVLAHYCADAFLYRFRIPGIRRVTLARLGFGG
jgi:hypothetical protein